MAGWAVPGVFHRSRTQNRAAATIRPRTMTARRMDGLPPGRPGNGVVEWKDRLSRGTWCGGNLAPKTPKGLDIKARGRAALPGVDTPKGLNTKARGRAAHPGLPVTGPCHLPRRGCITRAL